MTRAELRRLLLETGCALDAGEFVFLCDERWSADERRQTDALIAAARASGEPTGVGWLCVRTGGSSGGMKFARHDEQTLTAAIRGFCAHFGFSRVNAVNVLPLHHVSGLMALVRCAGTGGTHLAWDWKRLERGEFPALTGGGDWVVSLVPTQLARLLNSTDAVAWLSGFRVIFVGGGPVWPELIDGAARAGLRVSLSYGMTETAAMVAALQPEEFLAGARSSGRPLPHVKIDVVDDGRISVAGESVFRGYFGEPTQVGAFMTSDLGRFDERGDLHVLGRSDGLIVTGGEKVNPTEVEAVLRTSGEFAEVTVMGMPDAEWGEVVVACYPADGKSRDLERAVLGLAAHQRPKRFVAVRNWPRTAVGKVNREELKRLVVEGDRTFVER